jgi:hypothetical protein
MSVLSFILGVTGLGKELDNLRSGLQFVVDIGELSAWAAKSENVPALLDCASVAELWLTEAEDEAGQISTGALTAILTDGDPFAGSRKLAETVLAKYASAGFTTKAAAVAAKKVTAIPTHALTITESLPTADRVPDAEPAQGEAFLPGEPGQS